MCVKGARWVQEMVLKKYPDKEMEVYVVWFNMVATDRKDKWNPESLNDKRVKHYWDEKRILGRWITKNTPDCKHINAIDWDSFYLFDKDGEWTETFENLKACGTPVIKESKKLADGLEKIFNE
jgi:hypothetical protein